MFTRQPPGDLPPNQFSDSGDNAVAENSQSVRLSPERVSRTQAGPPHFLLHHTAYLVVNRDKPPRL